MSEQIVFNIFFTIAFGPETCQHIEKRSETRTAYE